MLWTSPEVREETTVARTFDVTPRPEALGGGWDLKLFENGREAGGAVFPLAPYLEEARQRAEEERIPVESLARGLALEDADTEGRAWTGEDHED